MNTKTNLYYTTFIQITNKNLLGVKLFHLSSTLFADNAQNTAQMVNNQINQEMLPVPKLQNTINNATNTTNTLLPNDINNLLDYLIPDKLINKILNIFRPVEVEGYLDDLI